MVCSQAEILDYWGTEVLLERVATVFEREADSGTAQEKREALRCNKV